MKTGRNDSCPCGSGKKYKKCCLNPGPAATTAAKGAELTRSSAVLFKPVQFFATLPIRPSSRPGQRGAVVQFVIPGLRLGADRAAYVQQARACGTAVENASFDAVTRDSDKQPGTLVSIAFHYISDATETPTPSSERVGRLIAEKFVSLLSFGIGERLVALNQQVSEVRDDGQGVRVRLHPRSKASEEPRSIEIPDALIEKAPSEECFKALFWLRRGLAERDHLDSYAALMVTLEVLASLLVPKETTTSTCGNCGAETGKLTRSSVKTLVVEKLGADPKLFWRLWKARNTIVAHGSQAVTADVLLDVVDLKFDAIKLAFSGLKLALGLPIEGPPMPSQMQMMTDAFLGAE
jgi:hypothetical protein